MNIFMSVFNFRLVLFCLPLLMRVRENKIYFLRIYEPITRAENRLDNSQRIEKEKNTLSKIRQ